jgi:hypothetical protein
LQVADASNVPLPLEPVLSSLPELQAAATSGRPGTVVTQEVGAATSAALVRQLTRALPGIVTCRTLGPCVVVHKQVRLLVCVQEHPFLCRPFFMLHPCQMETMMQLLTEPGHNQPHADNSGAAAPADPGAAALGPPKLLRYMFAWLSMAGQPLGLGLPADLWLRASLP